MGKRSGVLLVIGLFVTATRTALADDPLPPKADLAVIESLSADIFKSLETIADLRARRLELGNAAKLAPEAIIKAEEAIKPSELAVLEFRVKIMPQDINTANGEIKLAENEVEKAKIRMEWSDRTLKKGAISEAQNLEDRMCLQKCQISLSNVKLKKNVLEKYAHPRELARLEDVAKKAKADLVARKAEHERTKTELADVDRQLAMVSLLPQEIQAIQALDEAIALFDQNKAKEAEARLLEAKTSWNAAQERRANSRYTKIKERLRDELKKIRK